MQKEPLGQQLGQQNNSDTLLRASLPDERVLILKGIFGGQCRTRTCDLLLVRQAL